MSGTTCCVFFLWTTPHSFVATFPTAILFSPQESNLKCRKDLRKALRLDHQRRMQKHVVSFRDNAYLWEKIIRVTLKSRESTRDSQVWPWEERNEKFWMVLCSACLGQTRVWFRRFWRSRRDACLGKPRVHAKSRSEHQKSTQTRRKHLGNIDQLWEDAYFDMDAIHGFIDAGLFGITRMMIEGNSEIKNVFSTDVASSLWEKPVLSEEQ